MKFPDPYYVRDDMSLEEFIVGMLSLGKPVETLLVGDFFEGGIGANTGMEIQFHKDGQWSSHLDSGSLQNVDLVGFYCIIPGEVVTTLSIDATKEVVPIKLEKGQALVLDNRKVRHSRKGIVGDRLLFRIWLTTEVV